MTEVPGVIGNCKTFIAGTSLQVGVFGCVLGYECQSVNILDLNSETNDGVGSQGKERRNGKAEQMLGIEC